MHSDSQNPLHRDSQPLPGDVEAIAFAFRDACERAVWGADSLASAFRFFRSVLTLVSVLRGARADAGLASVWDDAAVAHSQTATDETAVEDPLQPEHAVAFPSFATARRGWSASADHDVGGTARAPHAARTGGRRRRKTPYNLSTPLLFLPLPPQGVGGPPSRTMTEEKWAAPAPYPLPMAQRAQDPLHPENRHIPAN